MIINAGLIFIGAVLTGFSWWVLKNHFRIWSEYSKKYKKRDKKSFWTEPNYVVYRFNVYVLWPLGFFLGIASVLLGVLRVLLK